MWTPQLEVPSRLVLMLALIRKKQHDAPNDPLVDSKGTFDGAMRPLWQLRSGLELPGGQLVVCFDV